MDQSFEFVEDEKLFIYRDRLEKVEKDMARVLLLIDKILNLIQGTKKIAKKDDDVSVTHNANLGSSVLFREIV